MMKTDGEILDACVNEVGELSKVTNADELYIEFVKPLADSPRFQYAILNLCRTAISLDILALLGIGKHTDPTEMLVLAAKLGFILGQKFRTAKDVEQLLQK